MSEPMVKKSSKITVVTDAAMFKYTFERDVTLDGLIKKLVLLQEAIVAGEKKAKELENGNT